MDIAVRVHTCAPDRLSARVGGAHTYRRPKINKNGLCSVNKFIMAAVNINMSICCAMLRHSHARLADAQMS